MDLTANLPGRHGWRETGLVACPYRGSSMSGTFRPGDILLVSPASLEAVRPGDVILFAHPRPEGQVLPVVHRVRACTAAGLITQGDGCPAPDSAPVRAGELIGRVSFVERQGRVRRVWGGRVGQMWAAWRRLRRHLTPWLGWPYRALRSGGLVRRLWRPDVAQIHLTTANGPLIKYVHRRRTVATWSPQDGYFWCRKPYDLVIRLPSE